MGTALTLADLNTAVNHEPRIAHRRLADALGFSQVHKMGHLIERHIEALQRFGGVPSTVDETGPKGGRPGKTYWLNKKQALYLCTKSETANATEVTIQMVEVFDAFLKGEMVAAEAIPVRAHIRRRPKPGFGTIIADTNDLYPFVEEGDELVVEFTRDAGLGAGEPQSLVVAVDPVSGRPRPCWLMLTGGGAFGPAQMMLRRVDGASLPVPASFPVIGRVIGVNKPTAGERRAELARCA
ncbi:hypothetical protein [Xanthobacter tagetidis]|uniref:Uncharacterized protein n=1 Tax=Xanthobacter tagetidis TaxID=60216 RepID=A0A3L7AHH1_9HYPH|nr:hypothetical protein [Xanthobacter tagetidis]MBB6306210.1 hypothetical protein [Xanthobacter tagetidis]RLP79494.1 hypothetical protein D9R14_07465 [Xanthobacter tagetidis]